MIYFLVFAQQIRQGIVVFTAVLLTETMMVGKEPRPKELMEEMRVHTIEIFSHGKEGDAMAWRNLENVSQRHTLYDPMYVL